MTLASIVCWQRLGNQCTLKDKFASVLALIVTLVEDPFLEHLLNYKSAQTFRSGGGQESFKNSYTSFETRLLQA